MSFFNDLGRKISETGQGAVNKTKTIAETSRLNSAINDCKNKIEMTYREIGNFYMQKYGKNPDPEIAEKIGYIKELEGNIQNMQEEIRKINGYIQCPKCGKTVKNDAFFCDGCGERLRNQEPETRCAACGAVLQPNAAFCTKCGTPRNAQPNPFNGQNPPPYQQTQPFNNPEQDVQQHYEVHEGEQSSMPGQTPQDNSNMATKVCPACGYEMDANQKFCLRCGEKL